MGDIIGMGSLDHKNFGAMHPQFWRARTSTGYTIIHNRVGWGIMHWPQNRYIQRCLKTTSFLSTQCLCLPQPAFI